MLETAQALGRLGGDTSAAVKALLKYDYGTDTSTMWWIASALRDVASPECRDATGWLLAMTRNEAVRPAAIMSLARFRPLRSEIGPPLERFLADDQLRGIVIETLMALEWDSQPFRAALRREVLASDRARSTAAIAALRERGVDMVEFLRGALPARAAILGLGRMGPAARSAFPDVLDIVMKRIAPDAQWAMAQMRVALAPEAVDRLEELLRGR